MGKHSGRTPEQQQLRDAQRAVKVANQQQAWALKVLDSSAFLEGQFWLSQGPAYADFTAAATRETFERFIPEPTGAPAGQQNRTFEQEARAFLPNLVLCDFIIGHRDQLQLMLRNHDATVLEFEPGEVLPVGMGEIAAQVVEVADDYLDNAGFTLDLELLEVVEDATNRYLSEIKAPIVDFLGTLPDSPHAPWWEDKYTTAAFKALDVKLGQLLNKLAATDAERKQFDAAIAARYGDKASLLRDEFENKTVPFLEAELVTAWRRALPTLGDAERVSDDEVRSQAAQVVRAAQGVFVEQANLQLLKLTAAAPELAPSTDMTL